MDPVTLAGGDFLSVLSRKIGFVVIMSSSNKVTVVLGSQWGDEGKGEQLIRFIASSFIAFIGKLL